MMFCLATFAQQRSTTTTYPYNGLLINPAYAGSLNLLSVIAVHRKQWINVEGAPTYTALSANSSLHLSLLSNSYFKLILTFILVLFGRITPVSLYFYSMKLSPSTFTVGIT